MVTKTVTLDEEQVSQLKAALAAADQLCTSVISGKSGTIREAIQVASALTDLKRRRVLG
jgi:hypothetical protein